MQVQVTAFKERPGDKDLILADLIVETESQKGIVIGKGAAAVKQLGILARQDIEKFLGALRALPVLCLCHASVGCGFQLAGAAVIVAQL